MSSSTSALVRYQQVLTDVEQTTLVGFLAGHRGFTPDAYALDLRQFTAWCWQHHRRLFEVRRADIECFARHLEDRGKARGTVARRLCTIVGFYRYAEEEGVIEHSPAVHIRRPSIDYESHVGHLDRNELGAILVTAGLSLPRDHALVSLLALNGLRVSEALGANIDALGLERGHRTLTVRRKGGKIATMPLAPRRAHRRPGHRRPPRRASLHRTKRSAPRPSRRRSDRAPHRPPGRDHQAGRTAHPTARLHHGRLGRRRAIA
jgi:integrase/recombinase XerD